MELGGSIHGGSALERPESQGERSEAKGEAEGASEGVEELGRPLLEAQGAGRHVAMEVGRTVVHGGHAASCRIDGTRERGQLSYQISASSEHICPWVLEANLLLSDYTTTLLKAPWSFEFCIPR